MTPDVLVRPGPTVLRVAIGWPLPSVLLPEPAPDGAEVVGLVLDWRYKAWDAMPLQDETGWLFNRGTTYEDPPLPAWDFIELQTPDPREITDTIPCGVMAVGMITGCEPVEDAFRWTLADVRQIPSYLVPLPVDDDGNKLAVWSPSIDSDG